MVIDVDGAPPAAPAGAGVPCRICHLSLEAGDGSAAAPAPGSEVIRLGCGCKDELGAAHRHCAEAWFRIKGDRYTPRSILFCSLVSIWYDLVSGRAIGVCCHSVVSTLLVPGVQLLVVAIR